MNNMNVKLPGKPDRSEHGRRTILVCLGVILFCSYMVRDSILLSISLIQVILDMEEEDAPFSRTKGIEEPISCYSFLKEARSMSSTIVDGNGGKMHVNFTLENPGFWVSLHNKATDRVRWTPIVELGRYYETSLSRVWNKVLQKAPKGSRVLDVGGNIGYYSLFSASRGPFAIDTFEPADRNIMRMCEAVLLNKWMNEEELGAPAPGIAPSIDIHPIGLSDTDGVLVFTEAPNAPGSGSFAEETELSRYPATTRRELPVMKLDTFAEKKGWFETKPNIEVMKVDVEGHGANVLLGGEKLLRSGMVQNIFTETSYHKDTARDVEEMTAVKLLIDAGYKLAGKGGWQGPGEPNPWGNDKNLADNIFKYLKESPDSRHQYVNLWWSLKYNKEW